MFVNEEYIVLEAGVEVGLETEMHNHWVVVAVNVGIHSVETLEDLAQETGEGFREGNTW